MIAQPDTRPNENDVQFWSNEYDELSKRLANLEAQVSEIARKTESISKAIDDIQLYSYQYNLKLVGVPQTDPDEKTSDTVDLCLKVLSGIGADVSASDIDIAHRVPTRNQNGRRRQASQPWVIRLNTMQDLEQLRHSEAGGAARYILSKLY